MIELNCENLKLNELKERCKFSFKRKENYCHFYLSTGGIWKSGSRCEVVEVKCQGCYDYIDNIKVTLRKHVTTDKNLLRYIHKICVITQLGDFIIFDTWNEFKSWVINFFDLHQETIEFGYDYSIRL